MNDRILRRFIVIAGIATFAAFSFWMIRDYMTPPPGDFEVRQGDILLTDGKYDEALARFDAALAAQPDHRGARMGRAIAYLQSARWADAEAEFTRLIAHLSETLTADDPTGRGVLAAAYANRGILHDRQGRHAKALADYLASARVDRDLAEGPGLVDKILYDANPSSVVKRARYLYEQFQKPPAERLLRLPEKDAAQRMYKP